MKKTLLLLPVLAFFVAGCDSLKSGAADSVAPALPLVYKNSTDDFSFYLPASWRGFSVLSGEWAGRSAHGSIIILRNPQWRSDQPTQHIPIMVFTRHQWDADQGQTDDGHAGGIESEIGHNAKYVFAIWSRYNADDSMMGWQETDEILSKNQTINGPVLYQK